MTAIAPPPPAVRSSKAALWAGWIVGGLPCLFLIMGAGMAFAKVPAAAEGMRRFGYPDHLLPILGAVELACAILYLIPQTAVLGAILLTGYFGGATATHVRLSDPGFVMAVTMGVLIWLGLVLRDPRLRVLIPLRRP